jgi:hypothetical protein
MIVRCGVVLPKWNTLPRPALSSGPTPSHAVHRGPTASCSTAVHVGKKEKVHLIYPLTIEKVQFCLVQKGESYIVSNVCEV